MKTSNQRLLSVLALIALAPLTVAAIKLAHAAPPVTVTAADTILCGAGHGGSGRCR